MTTIQGGRHSHPTRLWPARRRVGLGQKQVAALLGYRSSTLISKFERGDKLPSLKRAFQFELLYGVPARFLFESLFEQVREELTGRAESSAPIKRVLASNRAGERSLADYCAFNEMLKIPDHTPAYDDAIRNHIIHLMHAFSDRQERTHE